MHARDKRHLYHGAFHQLETYKAIMLSHTGQVLISHVFLSSRTANLSPRKIENEHPSSSESSMPMTILRQHYGSSARKFGGIHVFGLMLYVLTKKISKRNRLKCQGTGGSAEGGLSKNWLLQRKPPSTGAKKRWNGLISPTE
jgi:hypothetical protein